MVQLRVLFVGVFGAILGCHHSSEPVPPPSPGALLVGPEGGTLEFGAGRLNVPGGALDGPTMLTVTVSEDALPDGFSGLSPIYEFGPAGTTFNQPATVRIPFDGDAEHATIFWTNASNGAYVALDTHVEGDFAVAEVEHFSSAFVATACEGDCCGEPSDKLDVLLIVDNSNSMAEEQELLAAQLPAIARALATGDSDADGDQDFPAVGSLHVGIASTDMGTGGYAVFTCDEPNFGDDAILATTSRESGSGCTARFAACQDEYDQCTSQIGSCEPVEDDCLITVTQDDCDGFYTECTADIGDCADDCASEYAAVQVYDADSLSADPDAFAHDVGCVARMGVGGCGFEQQLEASLKALSPSDSGIPFSQETVGHGDGLNAGLLREDAALLVLMLTDEDDCSAADAEIFNPNSAVAPGMPNLRCHDYPELLHGVNRYVDGLRALKADPSQVIFAAIAGIPEDLANGAATYEAILDDPRMQSVVSESDPTRLEVVCDSPSQGLAFPARRLVETAQSMGASSVVGSICASDFGPTVAAILDKTASRIAGSCE